MLELAIAGLASVGFDDVVATVLLTGVVNDSAYNAEPVSAGMAALVMR